MGRTREASAGITRPRAKRYGRLRCSDKKKQIPTVRACASMTLRLRNTLGRRIETVEPLEPGRVRMYTCGPTVYRYAHVGNLRSNLLADLIRRSAIAGMVEPRQGPRSLSCEEPSATSRRQ